jgi:cytochrome c
MRARFLILGLIVAGFLAGCSGGKEMRGYPSEFAGSARRGAAAIQQFRCGTCHVIPGIHGANGVFGPPLNQMSRRTLIAGEFPNTPQNLTRWVQAPTSMKPKTRMPDLGLTEEEAADVSAYLQTLR